MTDIDIPVLPDKPKFKKIFFITPAIIIVLGCLVIGGAWFYQNSYLGRVFPGVRVGNYDIGGLNEKEVKNFIENINNRYAREGIDLLITETNQHLKLNTVSGGENAVETINLDSDALSSEVIKIGRGGNFWSRIYTPISLRLSPVNIDAPLQINKEALHSEVLNVLSPLEDKVQNATVKNVTEAGSAGVVNERSGKTFDYATILQNVQNSLRVLSFQPVAIAQKDFMPNITAAEVRAILPELPAKFSKGPITIIESNTSSPRVWTISDYELTRMIDVRRDPLGSLVFTLKKEALDELLKNKIASDVETPAENARFTVENNKVKEFRSSANGLAIDYDAMFETINRLFEERGGENGQTKAQEVGLVIKEVVPSIQISNSNDLGIVELIGSGTSTFKDSHSRRIQNIANAVKRLNGTLIKPDEEFSSVKSAGPFTLENGFLPEQIIKGRQITEEVGGGMCQIGTTLFRMAMQTGLPITERHNHSLVVNYYADPVNGNPGTDATLYEPILDLKFKNDTGNYLLLLTTIDYKKQLLTFSLWGTKDGRSGWYTHPKVSKWIPAPTEVEYVKDTEGVVKPGDEKCQNAFRGAIASFMYTRVTPEGEKIERVFDSYYRPLPKICTISPSSTPPTSTLKNP